MDIVNMVAGIATAAGTLGLLILGIYGLSSWRSQLDWKESHDLAKRLLHNLYKLRDMVDAARNPFVQLGEADEAAEEWETSAYNKRWSRVTEARIELDTAMTEADVVWGKETPINKAEVELRKQIGKLFIAIKHLLNNKPPNEGLFTETDRDIIYSMSDRAAGNLDSYDSELDIIIGKYETYLEQYLGRKK